MAKEVEYHASKLGSLVQVVVSLIRANPRMMDDFDLLKSHLFMQMPELRDRSKCANCGASMREYVFILDVWDAILLKRMAEDIRHKVRKGIPFTEANQVRIPELDAPHSVRCRTTKASKLGLVAKVKSKSTGRFIPGTWLITKRGWEALRGDAVPQKVKVWRGAIEERYDATVTLSQVMQAHAEYAKKRANAGKPLKDDSRNEILSYDPNEWYQFGYHEGKIF